MRILVLFLVVALGSAYGQTSKGSFMVGGSMSIQNSKIDYSDNGTTFLVIQPSKTFTFSPSVGYFILNNWVAGITSSISTSKVEPPGGIRTTTMSHLTGIFTRYYFRFGKFGAFPEVTLRGGSSKTEYYQAPTNLDFFPGGTFEAKASLGNAKAGLGLVWFVADNVSLEAILSYSATATKVDDNTSTQKTTGFNLGLQFFIPIKKSEKSASN